MSESAPSVKNEIAEVERRWVQAHRDLDLAAIDEILAEDYAQIQADGVVVGKAETIRSFRSGKRRWDYANSDELRINVHGDVAILVGRWTGRGENDGIRFDYTARFLAIYVHRNSEWQLVADQSTPLSE